MEPVKALTVYLLAFLFSAVVWAEEEVLEVPVHRVVDGDTLDLAGQARPVRIELAGIDCPELDQPHGTEASEATRRWIGGRPVTVKAIARNRSVSSTLWSTCRTDAS